VNGRRHLEHVPALDGLRGLAVAVVLWFHADHLRGGYLGVDLFFTLSGYLITSLLVGEWRQTGRVALVPFWGRRVRRLLPALVVTLVAVGLLAQWQVLPAARGDLRDAGLATLGYVANWRTLLADHGYWDQALTPSWLEHTWSLAIEEQFYLLWPLVVVAVMASRPRSGGQSGGGSRERRVRLLGTVAAAGAVLSAGGMIAGSLAGATVERLYLGTDTRVAAILLGAAAACFQRATGSVPEWRGRDRRRLAIAAVAALAFLALVWTTLDGTSALLYRGGLLACGLAAVVIIVDITTPGPSVVARVLAVPPLRGLGAISYGLYLYHWPIYRLLAESELGLEGWGLTAAQVATSLAAAVLSHRFLEQPILQGRWRWPSIRLAPLGAATAVMALFVGSIGAVDIAPAAPDATRPDLGPRSAAERIVVTTTAPAAASGASTPATTAPVARVEELIDPVVLVVGDSVPYLMAEEGFVAQERRLGLTTVNGARLGCSIVPDEDAPAPEANYLVHDCRPQWPDLVAEYQPDVVMVMFGAFGSPAPRQVEGHDAFPCEPAYDRRWHDRLLASIDVLSSTGAVVDLVTAPTADDPPADPELFHERQRCINDVIEAVAEESPKAESIDLAGYICPDDECQTNVDGIDLRADGLHFRGAGALLTARWLAPQLKQVEIETAPAAG
jgi:peptidoglycan/LPS O-acetylase OafA/YrhL